jgi:hypothetical protein
MACAWAVPSHLQVVCSICADIITAPIRRKGACRAGDTLVVTKLDRLARLAVRRPDHRREPYPPAGQAQPGGAVYDRIDPVGWLLFNVLDMVAEFEANLI